MGGGLPALILSVLASPRRLSVVLILPELARDLPAARRCVYPLGSARSSAAWPAAAFVRGDTMHSAYYVGIQEPRAVQPCVLVEVRRGVYMSCVVHGMRGVLVRADLTLVWVSGRTTRHR